LGCTIGVGLGEEADAVLGIAAGAGLYYTPSGEIGVYGSLGGDLGAVLGVGYSEILTVVHGGSDALAGNCLAVTLAGGDGVVGSGSLLFDGHNGHLVGVAGSIGLGIGWPVAVFESYSHTWVRPVS
jgi:hypothetical protein